MFRALSSSLRAVSSATRTSLARQPALAQTRAMSGGDRAESDAEFDARYIAYFDRKDIDGWEIRKVRGSTEARIKYSATSQLFNVSGDGGPRGHGLGARANHHRRRHARLPESERLLPDHEDPGDHQGQVRRQGGGVLALHHAGADADNVVQVSEY